MKKILLTFILLILVSCEERKGFEELSTYSENDVPHIIVMAPSGDSKVYEYDMESKGFKYKVENGRELKFNFLPYPANYGFYPSTVKDGELLYGFLLSGRFTIQTLLETKPIANLKLVYPQKTENIIVAVPHEEKLRSVEADDLASLDPDILEILKIWLSNNRDNLDSIVVEDEKVAMDLISERSTSND